MQKSYESHLYIDINNFFHNLLLGSISGKNQGTFLTLFFFLDFLKSKKSFKNGWKVINEMNIDELWVRKWSQYMELTLLIWYTATMLICL